MLLLVSSLLAAALAQSDPEAVALRLDVSRDADGRPVLGIHAEYPAGEHDLTAVRVRRSAAGEEGVRVVGARDLEGRELQVDPGGRDRWLVHHPLGARFVVEARLEPTPRRDRVDADAYLQATLGADLMYSTCDWLLPVPEELDRGRDRALRLEWTVSEELGWGVASSLGAGRGPFEARLSVRDLGSCLLVAGELDLSDHEVPGGNLVVAVAGADWGFAPGEFARFSQRVTAFARGYLEDTASPLHLVALLPRGAARAGSASIHGAAPFGASAIFSRPSATLGGARAHDGRFAQVLMHEAFHVWSADLWRFPDQDRPYWFIEGFARFFARRLALRGGWIDLDGYVEDLNDVLREYAECPERGAGASRVAEQFWEDPDVRIQPYLLGDLIAARLDAAAFAHSGDRRGLEDVLRALVREARASPGGKLAFRGEELFERLEGACGGRLDDMRRSVLEGERFELPPDTFAPVLRLRTTELSSGVPAQYAVPVKGWRAAARARL